MTNGRLEERGSEVVRKRWTEKKCADLSITSLSRFFETWYTLCKIPLCVKLTLVRGRPAWTNFSPKKITMKNCIELKNWSENVRAKLYNVHIC